MLANCAACQKIKERKPDSEPALKSLAVHEPGAEWSVDLAGPFPADKNGNTYIVVAVDSFSRFVMAKAVKSTKAEETAQFLLEVAAIFGLPASQPEIGQCSSTFRERDHDSVASLSQR